MGEKVIRIRMLGGFSISYGEEAIVLKRAGSSKAIRLLQMLLLSPEGGISKYEVIDQLYNVYENGGAENSNKNLNNLVYRLRGQLTACGLPDCEYVEMNAGVCRFQCKYPLEVDARRFEQICKEAREAEGEERIRLFLAANEMYQGELLPANQSETWFVQKSNYFKELYVQTIRELEAEYKRKKDYKNCMALYARAGHIYPFDNWQVEQVRIYLETYQYREAAKIYNDTVELYAREMGTPPTAEMQECFEKFELQVKGKEHSGGGRTEKANTVKSFREKSEFIRDSIFEEATAKGAYYCTYPSFADYCRLTVRAKERNNEMQAVLMFLTLRNKESTENWEKIDLPVQMDLLKEVIGDALRIGDAYTRYGNRHFILMLTKADKDSCGIIFERIEKAYNKKTGKGELWYHSDMVRELGREGI